MKHYFIPMMLMAAAALASCNKTNLNEQKAQKESYVYTISAVAPDMVDADAPAQAPTRTDYTDGGVFSWSAGDAISVLFHNGDVNKFFTLTTTESGATVKFSGSIEAGYEIGASDGNVSDKKIWALFPASANHTYTAGAEKPVRFYVQPSVDFTTSHFSANIPMYDLVASEETALSFKNIASTYKFIVTGIKDGVSKVDFVVYNQTTYGLSGSWPIDASYRLEYDYASPGSANSTLSFTSNVTSNQAVFYVPCRIWGSFQPVITVKNHATGVAIKTFTAPNAKQPNYLNHVWPITLNVSEANGGNYYAPAITIDGDLSDWDGIASSFSNSSNTRIREWKFKSDPYTVYFYVKMRKNRAWNSDPGLYIGFDLDNDNSTGNGYGSNTGCEAFVKSIPFSNDTEGSEPIGFVGVDANSEVWSSGIGYHNGTVHVAHYDAGESLSSSSSNTYLELSIPRDYLGLPSAGNSITIGCSFNWYITDKVSVTME